MGDKMKIDDYNDLQQQIDVMTIHLKSLNEKVEKQTIDINTFVNLLNTQQRLKREIENIRNKDYE